MVPLPKRYTAQGHFLFLSDKMLFTSSRTSQKSSNFAVPSHKIVQEVILLVFHHRIQAKCF